MKKTLTLEERKQRKREYNKKYRKGNSNKNKEAKEKDLKLKLREVENLYNYFVNDINIDLNIIRIINSLNLFNNKISNKFYYLVKNKHKIF